MLHKKIKIILFYVIFISLSLSYYYIDYKYHDKKISIANLDKVSIYENDIIGYISIQNNMYIPIKDDYSDKTLDDYYVGYIKESSYFNEEGTTILAGHNSKYVFNYLHRINIGDKVSIMYNNTFEEYIVLDKTIINELDNGIFRNIKTYKALMLITCTNTPNTRLVVTLKKNKSS